MNRYKAARNARYEERLKRARSMAVAITFGQRVLAGPLSEGP